MTIASLLGLGLAGMMAVLIIGVGLWARNPERSKMLGLRPVDAFNDLPQKAGESIEGGTRIHVSLGAGAVGTETTTGALAGITVLESIADAATISDKPPVVTAGDGAAAMLAQETLRRAYERQNAAERYDHLSGRMAGPTPLSFTVGAMTTLKDENVSTSLLIGSFGNEVALMADAGWGENAHQIIGTDNAQAQAAAYVTADETLLGEDVYASGAYLLGGKPFHRASLHAQDVARLLIIAALFIGALLKLVGII
ncbi:MAG: hypothetical protein FJ030_01745 [Chloroflexi bacterium]|nr:hypothetical protein [Chloroflexota bacterium]